MKRVENLEIDGHPHGQGVTNAEAAKKTMAGT